MEASTGAATPHGTADLDDLVGVLLLARAAERLDAVTHVRFTTFREADRGRWDRPTRARLADTMSDGAPALVEGRRVIERLAEQRWLAWFPRPFGPHHAINVGGSTVDWVARRCPAVRLVRSHLAVRSWRAEVLQASGPVLGTRWGSRRLAAWVDRGSRVADDQVRWACVVEATARERDLVRAWAWGRAPVATAAAMADAAPVDPTSPAGLPGPDLPAETARTTLDEQSAVGALQWSVTGPEPR